MAKQQELDRLWRELLAIGKELSKEAEECKKRRMQTPRYTNLMRDEKKLKAEYERVKNLGTHNPLSVAHGDKMQREKVVGDLMGRNGPDTHHGVYGNKDRGPGK